MKKFILLLFCILSFTCLFSKQKQGAKKNNPKKDSIERAIIRKQDSAIALSNQISVLSQKGEKFKSSVDSLVNVKDMLLSQVNELKKITPDAEDEDVQSTILSISTLIFGGVLILLVLFFRNKDKEDFQSYKLIGIIFIGTVSVFLIPAGFDNNQITPIVGLLGTLAGYLVGSSNQHNSAKASSSEKNI